MTNPNVTILVRPEYIPGKTRVSAGLSRAKGTVHTYIPYAETAVGKGPLLVVLFDSGEIGVGLAAGYTLLKEGF